MVEEGVGGACPCCGRRTIGEPGGYEICPVCLWEDDGQDNHNADIVLGGPNGTLSLTQARVNYLRNGCADGAPAHMYASGRQFVLTDEAISEVGTRWRSQSFDRE